MFDFSIRKWIPKNRQEEQIMQQFTDSVDYLLSVDFPYADKLSNCLVSIKNKYKDVSAIPLEDLYAIIEETGYSYISDTLFLDEISIRNFVNFLNFIHQNKGSRKGLELALKLLDVEFAVKEWWEFPLIDEAEEHTFEVDLTSVAPEKIVDPDFITKLKNFLDNYVYPVVRRIALQIDFPNNKTGIAPNHNPHVDFVFMPDSVWLIWGFNQWSIKRWYTKESNPLIWDDVSRVWDIHAWYDSSSAFTWGAEDWGTDFWT